MTKRKTKPKAQRKRRTHSEEFKREAVKLVIEQQLSVAEAARNLGIHANLLRSWKRRMEAEREELTEDERMEIARLRAENRRLRMERDILPLDMSIVWPHIFKLLFRYQFSVDVAFRCLGTRRSWLICSTSSITPSDWRTRCSPAGNSSNP